MRRRSAVKCPLAVGVEFFSEFGSSSYHLRSNQVGMARTARSTTFGNRNSILAACMASNSSTTAVARPFSNFSRSDEVATTLGHSQFSHLALVFSIHNQYKNQYVTTHVPYHHPNICNHNKHNKTSYSKYIAEL